MSGDGPPLGSTYRLQLPGIGFSGARDLVAYLAALGVETLYVSPVLAAAPGSTHGYDVIDPTRLDPALGTPEEFEALLSQLDDHGMRLLVDIVPNHMSTDRANRWWWEVLRDGQGSDVADVFDIDWTRHGGRVLVPTLPRPLAELAGAAEFAHHDGERVLLIADQPFPVRRATRPTTPPADALTHQQYRPAYWKLGRLEGNYRRFFDIDGLVGVRVEDPAVFDRTHAYLIELGQDERIAGWRVDHIDGLADPRDYASRLRHAATGGRRTRPVVVAEKILAHDEDLRAGWAVDGTTGYEFADLAGGLFVDADGAGALLRLGHAITVEPVSFAELTLQAKREVLAQSFPAPLSRLAHGAIDALTQSHPGHDLALDDARAALAELTVHLDVYRTYIDDRGIERADRARLERAATAASGGGRLSDEGERALRLISAGLLGQDGQRWLELARRWQQLTGAVMAKGVEDTATYRYAGLLGHAEVGCDPDRAGGGAEGFHRLARSHLRRPSSLNATSTHDSKRSEDARARLFTLSEVPEEWGRLVRRWQTRYGDTPAPDAHDQLVCFQTLAALWPYGRVSMPLRDRARVRDYMIKAAREAKRRTSWLEPDGGYERVLVGFVARLARDDRFGGEMERFVARIGPAAATNSLATLVLKVTVPGVPDLYQGTELWDPTLTDPDNRRAVDFRQRERLLAGLPSASARPAEHAAVAKRLLGSWPDGRLKLMVTRALLHLRRAQPLLFHQGTYRVLDVTGPLADHVVAIARRRGRHQVIAVVPRLMVDTVGTGRFPTGTRAWATTTIRLPSPVPDTLTDVVTGTPAVVRRGGIRLAECLSVLPVAVLANDSTGVWE
jgi:(1->4)-alpha-D-glucan 1-alpha-D-glucosylmutase